MLSTLDKNAVESFLKLCKKVIFLEILIQRCMCF